MVAALCEEVKDPARSVPRAMGECTFQSVTPFHLTIEVLSVAAAAVTGLVYLVSDLARSERSLT
jgi:hypothetical protein